MNELIEHRAAVGRAPGLRGRTMQNGNRRDPASGWSGRRWRRGAAAALAAALSAAACAAALADGRGDDDHDRRGATQSEAVRFLAQSSFGPTRASVARVMQIGIRRALDEQFETPTTGYGALPAVPIAQPASCTGDGNPTSAATICARDNYSIFPVQRMFYANATGGADQLRQRVAFALSQITVVSALDLRFAYAMAGYQQLLLDHAFGNYRDILYEVTLSPVMGHYLDMVNNDKANPARGTKPNENYARELLQLFSVGLTRLHRDGTPVRVGGQPVPTYDQAVIDDLARVFTGWTYPPMPGATTAGHNPPYFSGRMVAVESNHDSGVKTILGGRVLPAGQTAAKDLNDAIDTLFNDPNVGPFVATRLIQHLVTSNPSPAYVARVAAAFDGRSEDDRHRTARGDMQAVLRAVLLDPEARRAGAIDPRYGKLQEPALFAVSALRALGGRSDGVYLRNVVGALGQDVFSAPSVFSFYPPAYPLPGSATLLGPEFAIFSTSTAIGRLNLLERIILGGPVAADPTVAGSTGTAVDLSALELLAADPGSWSIPWAAWRSPADSRQPPAATSWRR